MKTLEIGKCLQLRQNALVLNTSWRPLLKGQAPDTNPIFLPKFCWIFNLEGLSPRYWPHSCDTAFPYSALSVRVEGGGETGEVRVSCTTFSCPPYFCAPLPPDFHPSLCWSRPQVNQEDQKPGLTFKKIALKSEPLRTLGRAHWSDIPLKQVCIMRQNLQLFGMCSRTEQAPKKVFHERIFRCHTEKYWSRLK